MQPAAVAVALAIVVVANGAIPEDDAPLGESLLAANEVPMESKPLPAMRPGWLGGELPGLHGPTPQSAGEKLGPVIGETQELRGTGASVHDRSPLRPGMEVTLRGGRSDTFGCNWYKCGTPQSSTFEVVDGGDGSVALRMGGCWERRKRVKCERGGGDSVSICGADAVRIPPRARGCSQGA